MSGTRGVVVEDIVVAGPAARLPRQVPACPPLTSRLNYLSRLRRSALQLPTTRAASSIVLRDLSPRYESAIRPGRSVPVERFTIAPDVAATS